MGKKKWKRAKKESEEPKVAVSRSQSVAGLTNHEVDKVSSGLKRRGSERSQKKSVVFEGSSWWNTSMKYLFDMTSGKSDKSKKRRRHLSSDSRMFSPINGLNHSERISCFL